MSNHFHSPVRRKKKPAVPLPLLLFVLVGFAAGIVVSQLFFPRVVTPAADSTSSSASESASEASALVADRAAEPADASAETETTASLGTSAIVQREIRTPTPETLNEITEDHVFEQLALLSDYFADGSYWNHYGIDVSSMSDAEQAMCVTDTPCAHSANGYEYCNVYNGAIVEYFPQYQYETQCLGYASLISDLLFGTDAPVTEFYDFDSLRIGDHVRLVGNEHSMIVTDIDWETGTLTVTEVNADFENCEISWGRTITRDELYTMEGDVRFYTRYSD